MTWYAVFERATSVLVSVGTLVANPLAPEYDSLLLDHEPNLAVEKWATAQRAFVPLTPDEIAAANG